MSPQEKKVWQLLMSRLFWQQQTGIVREQKRVSIFGGGLSFLGCFKWLGRQRRQKKKKKRQQKKREKEKRTSSCSRTSKRLQVSLVHFVSAVRRIEIHDHTSWCMRAAEVAPTALSAGLQATNHLFSHPSSKLRGISIRIFFFLFFSRNFLAGKNQKASVHLGRKAQSPAELRWSLRSPCH